MCGSESNNESAEELISIFGIVTILSFTSIVFFNVENCTCFKSSTLAKLDNFSRGSKLINSPSQWLSLR